MKDPYLYPDSEILKNLADIRDEELLKEMGTDVIRFIGTTV